MSNFGQRLINDKCKLLGVTSYLNEAISFHVLTPENSLYSNIPIVALSSQSCPDKDSLLPLNELVYHNCNTLEFDLFTFEYLKTTTPVCFFPKSNRWLGAQYLYTLDFYTGNDLFHIMNLENGQYAAVPNHKVNWAGQQKLPKYKKSHQSWCV